MNKVIFSVLYTSVCSLWVMMVLKLLTLWLACAGR